MMKAAIFDLDGVIVSTDRFHYEAWKAMAVKNGWNFDEALNHRLRGVSRGESLDIIVEANNAVVEDDERAAVLDEKNATYCALLEDLSPADILPGVSDLLVDLRREGILCAIGSSSRNTPLILRKIGLNDSFDAVIDGNQISNSKPHPEVFSKGAAALNTDSSECIVFEDAQAGVDAARAAGMAVVGIGDSPLSDASAMMRNLKDSTWNSILKTIGH